MDYEKAYKDALERAKYLKENTDSIGALDVSACFEEIFPELKDSEDDRIKKAITHILYENYTDAAVIEGVEIAEIVTWLEKQGEQKRTPKYKIGDCIEYRGEKYKITNVTVTDNNFYYDVSLIKEPSDWGEVVAAIGMAAEEKVFKIEQEPSWSEEDEEMIDFMIEFIESLWWRKDLTKRKDEVLSWLKSIHPHWKPSEEQMNALKYFISFHEDHASSLTTKWEEFKNLESLYNDLKSL